MKRLTAIALVIVFAAIAGGLFVKAILLYRTCDSAEYGFQDELAELSLQAECAENEAALCRALISASRITENNRNEWKDSFETALFFLSLGFAVALAGMLLFAWRYIFTPASTGHKPQLQQKQG